MWLETAILQPHHFHTTAGGPTWKPLIVWLPGRLGREGEDLHAALSEKRDVEDIVKAVRVRKGGSRPLSVSGVWFRGKRDKQKK